MKVICTATCIYENEVPAILPVIKTNMTSMYTYVTCKYDMTRSGFVPKGKAAQTSACQEIRVVLADESYHITSRVNR